jgi:hypothetical protein
MRVRLKHWQHTPDIYSCGNCSQCGLDWGLDHAPQECIHVYTRQVSRSHTDSGNLPKNCTYVSAWQLCEGQYITEGTGHRKTEITCFVETSMACVRAHLLAWPTAFLSQLPSSAWCELVRCSLPRCVVQMSSSGRLAYGRFSGDPEISWY